MSLDNFSWVIPGRLAGCAIPGGRNNASDQAIAADLVHLRSLGVSALVSLHRMPGNMAELCREAGLKWIEFPVDDFEVPANASDFSSLVDQIIRLMDHGQPVCVHCRAGVGRTGLLLACVTGRYFGIAGDKAIAAVRKARPALDTGEQEAFVREFCGAQA